MAGALWTAIPTILKEECYGKSGRSSAEWR